MKTNFEKADMNEKHFLLNVKLIELEIELTLNLNIVLNYTQADI